MKAKTTKQKQPKPKESSWSLVTELVELANSVPEHELDKVRHDRSVTYKQRLYGAGA